MEFRNFVKSFIPSIDKAIQEHDPETDLRSAVKEAQMMVRFASEHKQTLEASDIEIVGAMHRALKPSDDPTKSDGGPTLAQEVAFWNTYEKLATVIAPATVESILITRGICDYITGEAEARSPASRKVRWYRRFTVITFVLLFIVQMFWFTGNQIMKDLEVVEKAIASLENEIEATRFSFEQEIGNAEVGAFPERIEAPANYDKPDQVRWVQSALMQSSQNAITPLQNQLDHEINMREAAYFNLKIWDRIWSTPILIDPISWDQQEFDKLKQDSQLRIMHKGSQSALLILSELILPLLFALLGSAVFVLRNISQHIENNDLSASRLARMSSRLILGMISGVALSWLTMSWFIMPEAASTPSTNEDIAQSLGLLRSLGPWLTAFVAGYSVEILFSLMDTIVQAFTKKPPPAAGK